MPKIKKVFNLIFFNFFMKIMEFFESQKCKIFEIIIDDKLIEKHF